MFFFSSQNIKDWGSHGSIDILYLWIITVIPAHYEDKCVASLYCFVLQVGGGGLPLTLWQCSLQSCDKIPTLLCNDCWEGPVVINAISEKKKLLKQVQLFTTIGHLFPPTNKMYKRGFIGFNLFIVPNFQIHCSIDYYCVETTVTPSVCAGFRTDAAVSVHRL